MRKIIQELLISRVIVPNYWQLELSYKAFAYQFLPLPCEPKLFTLL